MTTSDELSPSDADLLFGDGASAETNGGGEPAAHEVQTYDFRRPARISKDRKRSLEAMYGLLAKSIESWITGRTRDQIEVELQSVEQLTFGEFVLSLPSPCTSYILEIPGAGRQGVIDFGPEFAYYIVDRLLGGTGSPKVPARSLTAIEREVVRIVGDRVAFQLSEAWKDYVRLDLSVAGFESIPEMLQVANREDPVLTAQLGVTMGSTTSVLLLCLPFAIVEKFFSGGSARRPDKPQGSPEELQRDRGTIETTVRDVRITVGARLPRFQVPLHALADLEVGSILATGLNPLSDLELYVSGQRRFAGKPGRVGHKLAVRVMDPLSPEPEDLIRQAREIE